MSFMDEDEAELYFLQLDEEGGGKGDLDRNEFIESVIRLQNEEKAIEQALLKTSGLIEKVDRIFMVLVVILSSILALAIFEPPIAIIFSYFVSILASLVFLFGSTVKTLFDSIMYIIVNHPFDQDDWLMLGDGSMYQVKEIGLLTSTFLCPQNDLVYINNLSLNDQAVVNITRSGSMKETITLAVLPETNKTKLAQLEQACQGWLRNHPHLYLPQLSFSDFEVTDSLHLRIKMRLTHRANFDDMTKKDHRSRMFMLFLKDSMIRLGIQPSPPVLPSSVKPFMQ
jgi:small-conductance mechanosensitive channel